MTARVVVGDCREANELRARLSDYERRFGISTADVHAAIDRGDLHESHDVCRWLIDADLLARIAAEGRR